MHIVRTLAVSILLLLSQVLHATTYVVPSDDELIKASRAIVVGTVIDSYSRRAANGMIETVTQVLIDEQMKGTTEGRTVSIAHWGGQLDGEWLAQSGAPQYAPGERVLLFLDEDARGAWTTYGLGLGSFRFERDATGATTLRRMVESDGDGASDTERPRLERSFLEYIRAFVGEKSGVPYVAPEPLATSVRFEIRPESTFTSGSYTSRFSGHPDVPIRRFGSALEEEWQLIGTQGTLDLAAAVDFSLPKWNAQGSSIDFSRSGTPATGNTVASDSEARIIANDPNGVVSGACCPGVVATAFQFGITADQTFNGETFYAITHSDIVVNNGADTGNLGQGKFNAALAHEVGHTLGLRHSDNLNSNSGTCTPPLDCCAGSCVAIMKAAVPNPPPTALQTWDKNAIKCVDSAVCADSGSCTTPSISTHPANKTITPPATSTSLSVTATGSAPLTYQWFVGSSGDTSQPTGTNSNSITVSPVDTTNYWVRVSNTCEPLAPANSNTATVTVAPCAPPQISSHSNDRTITAGTSTQLTVTAAGTATLHYQWYIGQPGNTTQPTGPDNKNFTVSPTTTTTYWVRVTGACAPAADSGAIVVTVQACPAVVVGTPTKLPSGGSVILDVTAASTGGGALSYAWFLGNTPGSGGTQVGNTKSITVAVTSEVKSYWVRVTNSCNNSAVSELVAVASCSLPAIETQPADQSITTGNSATLSLVLVGDGAGVTVTWYSGTSPDKTTQIGIGTSVNVGPLTATTSYWAAIRNSCGEVSTRTAVITVNACAAPTVTTQPLAQQISANTTATLQVIAEGTATLLYQWYEGLKSDTALPIEGETSPTFTTPKLLKSTSYWVRVTNGCGSADSEAALITVQLGRRRAVSH